MGGYQQLYDSDGVTHLRKAKARAQAGPTPTPRLRSLLREAIRRMQHQKLKEKGALTAQLKAAREDIKRAFSVMTLLTYFIFFLAYGCMCYVKTDWAYGRQTMRAAQPIVDGFQKVSDRPGLFAFVQEKLPQLLADVQTDCPLCDVAVTDSNLGPTNLNMSDFSFALLSRPPAKTIMPVWIV